MKILVTGGAGYIGSFMVNLLLDKKHDVVVFDSLERGHKEALNKLTGFVKGDIKSVSDLKVLFQNHKFDALLHFAAYISVGESEKEPDKYFANNVIGSKKIFTEAIKNGVNKIIFSSSAAVYGNPQVIPIPEDHPKKPTSEYGKNKLAMEKVLFDLQKDSQSFSFVCLRYFNAAGAAINGSIGEGHMPETHIIPLAIKAAINNSEFKLYGTDYNTPDGTCIRDYIHVLDLVEAHVLALEKIEKEKGGYFYNVGTGNGYSNRQVLETVKEVSKIDFSVIQEKRRAGDADQLVADPARIKHELGFVPKYSDLSTIVQSAWKWHNGNL